MKRLDRYVGGYVIGATALALFAFLALFSFIGLVDDLGDVGKGAYTVRSALEQMVLEMPRLAFALFPVAAVVGSLMGLGVLASSSELVVIRAAGVSVLRLTGAVMRAAGVLAVMAVVLGEFVAPPAERLAEQRRSSALTGGSTLRTGAGYWIRDADSFINIRRVVPGREMRDIYIYELDAERRLRVVTHAREAVYEDGAWRLGGIRQSRIEPTGVVTDHAAQATWNSVFRPELVDVAAVRPDGLSGAGLLRYIRYLRANGLSAARFELALWQKITYPLATAVMVLLAVPLVLGRPRGIGIGQRMLVGSLVGVTFHILNQATGHMGLVYGLDPALCAVAPTLVFAGVAVALMSRVH